VSFAVSSLRPTAQPSTDLFPSLPASASRDHEAHRTSLHPSSQHFSRWLDDRFSCESIFCLLFDRLNASLVARPHRRQLLSALALSGTLLVFPRPGTSLRCLQNLSRGSSTTQRHQRSSGRSSGYAQAVEGELFIPSSLPEYADERLEKYLESWREERNATVELFSWEFWRYSNNR